MLKCLERCLDHPLRPVVSYLLMSDSEHEYLFHSKTFNAIFQMSLCSILTTKF